MFENELFNEIDIHRSRNLISVENATVRSWKRSEIVFACGYIGLCLEEIPAWATGHIIISFERMIVATEQVDDVAKFEGESDIWFIPQSDFNPGYFTVEPEEGAIRFPVEIMEVEENGCVILRFPEQNGKFQVYSE